MAFWGVGLQLESFYCFSVDFNKMSLTSCVISEQNCLLSQATPSHFLLSSLTSLFL